MTNITQHEVFKICDNMHKKSERPTINKLRQALGNRGSNTTLGKYLNQYKGADVKSKKSNRTKEYWEGYKDAIKNIKNMINSI